MAAGQGFKTFTTGEVLSASDVNGYLMQGVLVFASAATRDAAITSPQEGQFAYLKDTNVTTYYTGSAWANLDTTGMTNPMTTTGDTIYSSSGSTPARLGIGSTGQVLTVSGGVPTWASAASGGMTLLTSGSLTGSSVTTASLSQSYIDLYVIIRDWYPATDLSRLRARVNGVSAANSYVQGINAGSASTDAFNSDYIGLSIDTDNTVHKNIATISIPDYANTVTYKYLYSNSFAVADTTTSLSTYAGIYGITKAIDAVTTLTFFPSSGNFSGGNYYVYGVK